MNLVIDRAITKAMMPVHDYAYLAEKGMGEVEVMMANSNVNTITDDTDIVLSNVLKDMVDDGTPPVVYMRSGTTFIGLLDGCLEVYGITIHEIDV